MPRDGAQIYSPPFPDVAPDTTIASTVYNGFVHDVAQDLNTPRPVIAGGTGANNATDAMNNLGGELSKVAVTNYDAHPFQAGSFYSLAGATGAPTVNACTGICYVSVVSGSPSTDMFIEARDQVTSTLYVRQKKANVWQGWTVPAGFSTSPTPPTGVAPNTMWWDNTRGKLFIWYLDPGGPPAQWVEAVAVPDIDPNTFVEISGDIMTGYLTLNAPPVNPLHAATKAYTDSSISTVLDTKAVRYDAAQGLTSAQQSQARANINVTKKNYIINGAMMVSQENGATALTAAGFPVDMFYVAYSVPGTSTSQIGSRSPAGSANRLRTTITAAHTAVAGDIAYIIQSIEGTKTTDLSFGTAAAKTITIQFGVKAPAGTYCVTVSNNAANRSYVAEYVITAGEANTDVIKSVIIPGDTAGTWLSDNNIGLQIRWCLMCSSTFQTSANIWTAGNFYGSANQFNFMSGNGNVFELFDVGLYESNVAPSFQVPDYASELQLCLRYWERLNIKGMASGNLCSGTWAFSAPKRTTGPTLTYTDTPGNASRVTTNSGGSGLTITGGVFSSDDRRWVADVSFSGPAAGWMSFVGTANARL